MLSSHPTLVITLSLVFEVDLNRQGEISAKKYVQMIKEDIDSLERSSSRFPNNFITNFYSSPYFHRRTN